MLDKLLALLPDGFHHKKPVVPTPEEQAVADYIEGPPETKAEATKLLEDNHYCMKHLVPMEQRISSHLPGERQSPVVFDCKICYREAAEEWKRKNREEDRRKAKAVAILKGELPAKPEYVPRQFVPNPTGLPYYPDGDTINERTPVPTEEVTNA